MHAQPDVARSLADQAQAVHRDTARGPGPWSSGPYGPMAVGVIAALNLCPGCACARDCTSNTGILDLSISPEEEHSDAFQDAFEGQMQLLVLHLEEEYHPPLPDMSCTFAPNEDVAWWTHGLDFNGVFEVPAGWTCAMTYGRETPADSDEVVECSGYLPPVEVSACATTREEMIVSCGVIKDEGD